MKVQKTHFLPQPVTLVILLSSLLLLLPNKEGSETHRGDVSNAEGDHQVSICMTCTDNCLYEMPHVICCRSNVVQNGITNITLTAPVPMQLCISGSSYLYSTHKILAYVVVAPNTKYQIQFHGR